MFHLNQTSLQKFLYRIFYYVLIMVYLYIIVLNMNVYIYYHLYNYIYHLYYFLKLFLLLYLQILLVLISKQYYLYNYGITFEIVTKIYHQDFLHEKLEEYLQKHFCSIIFIIFLNLNIIIFSSLNFHYTLNDFIHIFDENLLYFYLIIHLLVLYYFLNYFIFIFLFLLQIVCDKHLIVCYNNYLIDCHKLNFIIILIILHLMIKPLNNIHYYVYLK